MNCKWCDRKIVLSRSPDGTGQEIWYHPEDRTVRCYFDDDDLPPREPIVSVVPVRRATPKE